MSEEYKKCECYSDPDDCDFLGSTCSHTDCLVKDLIKDNQRLREALNKLQDNLDNILLPDYEEDYGNYNAFYQSSSAVIKQALGE